VAVGEVEEEEGDALLVGGYALGGEEEFDGAGVAGPRGGGGRRLGLMVVLRWDGELLLGGLLRGLDGGLRLGGLGGGVVGDGLGGGGRRGDAVCLGGRHGGC
jgi:hypothetical protein